MNLGKLVFAQITQHFPLTTFRRCVARYGGEHKVKSFSCLDQYLCMAFAQLTYRESLRDIEACLRSRRRVLYHAGIRGDVKRCNLAYANEHRDARLFADVTTVLMRRAQRLCADKPDALSLDGDLFAIDATLIDLSLALFPWARWQGTQAAVKLNVMLAVASDLPAFCTLVAGTRHDVHFLDEISIQPGSYYCLDRGYVDYARLHRFTAAGAWFVTRAKANIRFYVRASRPVDAQAGMRCDQTIKLSGPQARRDYPEPVRRIRYLDPETGLMLVFLTNNFSLPAHTIALIYRHRWRIELFFKWLKQHLRLRGFFSNSPNGVAVQIWTALSAYLLVAIVRQELALPHSLHEVLQVVSISALEKVPLPELFAHFHTTQTKVDIPIQLEINGF